MCMFPFSKLRLKIWKSIGPASLITKRATVTSIETKTAATGAQPPASVRANIAIAPVNLAAPAIQMRLLLPKGWNGTVVMLGGDGANDEAPTNFSGDALKKSATSPMRCSAASMANSLIAVSSSVAAKHWLWAPRQREELCPLLRSAGGYSYAASTAFSANWDSLRELVQ